MPVSWIEATLMTLEIFGLALVIYFVLAQTINFAMRRLEQRGPWPDARRPIMNFFDWEFAREILPRLLDASLTTIGIALAGFAIAVVLGLFLAIGRRSLPLAVRPVTGLINSSAAPLLIQVYFLFYVFPNYGLQPQRHAGRDHRYRAALRLLHRRGLPRRRWTRCRARSGKRSPR